MKKIYLSLLCLCCFVKVFSAANNIMYSYEYNRYYKKGKDVVFNLGADWTKKEYEFRNKKTKKQISNDKDKITFSFEVVERRKKFSYYQNINFITIKNLELEKKEVKANSVNFRFGATKDFFIPLPLPFTTYIGGGIVGRFDWIKTKQELYKDFVCYIGVSLKAGATIHFMPENSYTSLFFNYQPDIYIISNVKSSGNGFSVVDKWRMDNTITVGLQINCNQIIKALQNSHANRLAKQLSY